MPSLKTLQTKGTKTPEGAYNYVVTCGNIIQIFTPERFQEIPEEVERLISWGNKIHEIEIGLIEADDPFG